MIDRTETETSWFDLLMKDGIPSEAAWPVSQRKVGYHEGSKRKARMIMRDSI